jgi:hypothetical protein
MIRKPKILAYGALALALIFLGPCAVRHLQPAFAKYRLKRAINKIEPWTASTNYSVAGWKQLVAAAKKFQDSTPDFANTAVGELLENNAGQPGLAVAQAKIFLLLRMVFELPENSPGQPVIAANYFRGRSDMNPDGTFNLAWPISLSAGLPRLVSGCEGVAGDNYSPQKEFNYLRFHFKYRDLAKVQFP